MQYVWHPCIIFLLLHKKYVKCFNTLPILYIKTVKKVKVNIRVANFILLLYN